MDKKEKFFKSLILSIASMGIGAGAMYLANYKELNFMSRYPELIEVDNYARKELEIAPPENPDKAVVADAYFRLYDDEYTFVEESLSPHSAEYGIKKVNDSSTAKESGFKIKFNEKKQPYFSAVVKGLPADKQGIKVGDVVKKVDDYELTDYNHAIRLTGENGTTVKLFIERDGKEFSLDFVRKTDSSQTTGVSSEMYGDTLYISIDSMNDTAVSEFTKALSENKFESVIIDLRDNGGGYTQTAISAADMFIGASETVMHAKNNSDSEVYKTDEEIVYDVPIAVLINEKTASAAEILTALLKQYGDATLVGTNTFGKGIFQNRAFYKGESVRYTEGYYTVGDWENYHKKGIKPDIEIDMDSQYIGTDKDIQLQKAIEVLK